MRSSRFSYSMAPAAGIVAHETALADGTRINTRSKALRRSKTGQSEIPCRRVNEIAAFSMAVKVADRRESS